MTKKKYNHINHFLEDKSFNNWVYQKNATDINFWDVWIENNPERKDLVEKARDLITGISFKRNLVSKEKVSLEWNKLQATIKEKQIKPKRKVIFLKQITAAASVLLLIIASFYFLNRNPLITHKTNFGETLKIKLLDGSDVNLNSNSSISYYTNDSRKVWLSGEAFFQVDKKENTNAKFFVLTDDLSVEVYGTTFNVNTKKEKTAVFLEEGNIWLSLKNGETKKMKPGNFLSYSSKKNKVLEDTNIYNSTLKTSWKDGTLLFENLSLAKAMGKIEESYGYTIIFKDSKSKNTLITGAVPLTNLNICIKAIEKSTGVTITKKNNTLIISKK